MATSPFPASPEAVTPEWLTAALRASGALGPGGTVTSVAHATFGEGFGFVGLMARLIPVYSGDAGSAPATIISKFPPLDPGSRQIGLMYGVYEREVRFYSEIARDSAIEVPRCYFAGYDAAAATSLILMEDLEGKGRFGEQLGGCTLDEARLAIAALARFHAAWWDSPRLLDHPWLSEGMDLVRTAMSAAYEECAPLYLERFGHTLSAATRAAIPTLHRRILALVEEGRDQLTTLIHGDYRLDNMFFSDDPGRPHIMFDWQSLNRGPAANDLAYFIVGSLDVKSRRRHEGELVGFYHDRIASGGVTGISLEQMKEEYRLTLAAITGLAIIEAALLPTTNERGIALMELMNERFATAIEDLDAFAALPPG